MRKRYLTLVAAALVVACGDSTEPRVPTSVQVDQSSVMLQVGESAVVGAVVVDQHGRAYDTPPEGFAITWTSLDGNVATVQNGQITGVGTGQTTIRATAGSLAPAEVQVQVEGDLLITGGTFDLPILFEDDGDDRVVTAQIAFDYSGHRSGSLAVDNTFALGEVGAGGSYAFTFANLEFDDQDFVAWERRADGLLDYMEFYVSGTITEAGTYTVYLGLLLIGFDVANETFEAFYLLDRDPGTVTVTTATDTTLAGTFELTMQAEQVNALAAATAGAADGTAAYDPGRARLRQLGPRVPFR